MEKFSGTEWVLWDFRRTRHFRRVFSDTLNFKFVIIFMKSTTDSKVWMAPSHRGKILRCMSADLHVKEINASRTVKVGSYLAEALIDDRYAEANNHSSQLHNNWSQEELSIWCSFLYIN